MTITIATHASEDGVPWINASGQEVEVVQGAVDRVGREIARWVQTTRGGANARPNLLNRAAYQAPTNPYAQMTTARSGVESDDILSGVADITEGLIFQGLKWEANDADDADIFNQISRDLNLDEFVRQWYREDYTYSQAVVGVWWGEKQYKPRSKTETGRASKRKLDIACPVGLTLLDPTKVVPLKPGPFGQDRLAWHATDEEYATAVASYDNAFGDAVLREFTIGPLYIADKEERVYLESVGVDYKRLLALNPAAVFRICRTKASYERFPSIRLRSTFNLLDLKSQLMEADRVSLVGAANFILLVRQGDKENPASQAEIDNLKDNFKVVAKLPVVVGDHRLQIDIITPEQEWTLDAKKYDTIDRRLTARALGALSVSGSASEQRSTSGSTLTRGIARYLENRRHMLKRALEAELARTIMEHPRNLGKFKSEPNLTFTPRNVQLDSDSEVTRAILSLRTTRDLSRESTLEYFGFDQTVEALRRELEAEVFDDIFKTQVPFSSPDLGDEGGDGEPPQVSGGRGGRPPGGGDSPQSPQGQNRARTPSGQPST